MQEIVQQSTEIRGVSEYVQLYTKFCPQ